MFKFIDLVGGYYVAEEIVRYHRGYFKNYAYYDVRRKCFSKTKDESRPKDFLYVNFLIGEVKKYTGDKI